MGLVSSTYLLCPTFTHEPEQTKSTPRRRIHIVLIISTRRKSPGMFGFERERFADPPRTWTHCGAQHTSSTASARWKQNLSANARMHVRSAVYLFVPVSYKSKQSLGN